MLSIVRYTLAHAILCGSLQRALLDMPQLEWAKLKFGTDAHWDPLDNDIEAEMDLELLKEHPNSEFCMDVHIELQNEVNLAKLLTATCLRNLKVVYLGNVPVHQASF